MVNIQVIANEQGFLVINKPAGLPSAPILNNDSYNAFSMIAKKYPEVLSVNGRKEIEHGLIHRLDTVTSGLMIIAKNQECYDNFIKLQKENKIIKTYTAICEKKDFENDGFPPLPNNIKKDFENINNEIILQSYFRAYGEGRKQVRPVTEDSGKAALNKLEKKVLYTTKIKIIKIEDKKITVRCEITNGYRHQIRCHLAWLGLPIIGDPLYNNKGLQEEMNFVATEIKLPGTRFELA